MLLDFPVKANDVLDMKQFTEHCYVYFRFYVSDLLSYYRNFHSATVITPLCIILTGISVRMVMKLIKMAIHYQKEYTPKNETSAVNCRITYDDIIFCVCNYGLVIIVI